MLPGAREQVALFSYFGACPRPWRHIPMIPAQVPVPRRQDAPAQVATGERETAARPLAPPEVASYSSEEESSDVDEQEEAVDSLLREVEVKHCKRLVTVVLLLYSNARWLLLSIIAHNYQLVSFIPALAAVWSVECHALASVRRPLEYRKPRVRPICRRLARAERLFSPPFVFP